MHATGRTPSGTSGRVSGLSGVEGFGSGGLHVSSCAGVGTAVGQRALNVSEHATVFSDPVHAGSLEGPSVALFAGCWAERLAGVEVSLGHGVVQRYHFQQA